MGVDKKTLLAHAPLALEEVAVPELVGLGGVARVRAFNTRARNAFYAPVRNLQYADPANPTPEEIVRRNAVADTCDEARLAVFTLVDAEGQLLFQESDIDLLREWPPHPLDRIAAVARRLNGLGGVAAEHASKN